MKDNLTIGKQAMQEFHKRKTAELINMFVNHPEVRPLIVNPDRLEDKIQDFLGVILELRTGKARDAVLWFGAEMEKNLKENDYKGGWFNCGLNYLSKRLSQERKELYAAIKSKNRDSVVSECADIANFAMMIADQYKHNFGK